MSEKLSTKLVFNTQDAIEVQTYFYYYLPLLKTWEQMQNVLYKVSSKIYRGGGG